MTVNLTTQVACAGGLRRWLVRVACTGGLRSGLHSCLHSYLHSCLRTQFNSFSKSYLVQHPMKGFFSDMVIDTCTVAGAFVCAVACADDACTSTICHRLYSRCIRECDSDSYSNGSSQSIKYSSKYCAIHLVIISLAITT